MKSSRGKTVIYNNNFVKYTFMYQVCFYIGDAWLVII